MTSSSVTAIHSRDNAFVKDLRRLAQDTTAYRKQGRVWLEGDHLCRAALARADALGRGRAAYALRKQTVEPVFGIIKSVMGFRQFLLRGVGNVRNEWTLVCLAWNFKRMAALRLQ